jgi:hypothetical protein
MVVVPSFLTISLSTGLFIGHPVGGLTGGEETRVLSIYAFISTNPSANHYKSTHPRNTSDIKVYT